MVSALHRKLLRELWYMRGQALAIAVVLAGGVATLIMSLTSLDSLQQTRDAFYRDYRFADVFVDLTRAPEPLREAIAAIPGVQHVETRVMAAATLNIPGFNDAATGLFLSLPDGRNAEINRLYLRSGRFPEGASEVVLSEAFAEAHGFTYGATLSAVINGRHQTLRVVGIALSPEHIYQISPGDLFPDFERFGVLWMSRSQLGAAYDMDGAFNSAALTLSRDAREGEVIERLDALLAPYGSRGAIGRDDQLSHRYLDTELGQLEMMATVFPTIFLAVAAFLLNVVLTRLVGTQRDQIAILKAFGYSNLSVGLHYAQLVVLISLLGLVLGIVGGLWLGQQMAGLYQTFFRFPFLEYQLRPGVVLIAVGVSLGAALVGALVRSAQARVRTATFELESARAALAYAGGQDADASGVFELRTPISGQVLQRHVESSRVVQAGEPLLEIGDLRSLEIAVDVLSLDAVRIDPGMRVLVERWGSTEALGARVHRVEPVAYTKVSARGVEEQRVWVIARFTDPPERWARLGDGYRVNARFILWEEDDVLQLPTSALFRHSADGQDGWTVFVVHNGAAQLRRVSPGQRAGLMTQVAAGVQAGERVIVHPGRDLSDGTRVGVR